MKYTRIHFLVLTMLSLPVWAKTPISQTPITQSQATNSEDIAAIAALWGLDTEDYIRYTQIIKGPLGRWNANIDPILALGIYAESHDKKRRYAERYAKQEYELTLRTLAFQREYRSAFNRLYPDAQIIENHYLQGYYDHQSQKGQARTLRKKATAFQAGDRILYFPTIDCQSCDYQIKALYNVLRKNANVVLDIYVVGAKQDSDVRAWAKQKDLNIDWIKQSRMTLNINNGLLEKLNTSNLNNSYLYLSRNQSVFKIDPKQVGL